MLVREWRGEGVSGHCAGLRGESECWCGGEGGRSEPVRERPPSGGGWSWWRRWLTLCERWDLIRFDWLSEIRSERASPSPAVWGEGESGRGDNGRA